MKTRLYISLLLLIGIFSSCESWIDEKNYVKYTKENAYESKESVMANLYGLYAMLNNGQLYGGGVLRNMSDMASDCLRSNSGVNEWSGYKFTSTSNHIKSWWKGNYALVNASNALIHNVDSCPGDRMDDGEKAKVRAEAKFFRALAYFNLIRAYGRVPLLLNSPTDVCEVTYPYRSELSEIYDLIISDLKEGIELLDRMSGTQSGRVTRGSAAGMLAKVYLTRAYSEAAKPDDFKDAVLYCENIMLGEYGDYQLMENYADVFSPENEGNAELLFFVTFDFLPNTPSSIIKAYSPSTYYPIVSGGSPYAPYTLVNSYDQNYDQRFKHGFMNKHPETGAWLNNDKRYFFCKYKDSQKTESGEDRCDFPVLRYSDILLMHSEAMHSGNISVSANGFDKFYGINAVRDRARMEGAPTDSKICPLNSTNATGDFIDIILQERVWEFNCECQRRWDLIRTGKLEERMTYYFAQEGNDKIAACSIKPEHILFPMPQTEVDSNPNLVPDGETNNGYLSSGEGGDIEED